MPADPPGDPSCVYMRRDYFCSPSPVAWVARGCVPRVGCVGCSVSSRFPGALAVARAWAGVEIGLRYFGVGDCN